MFSATQHRRERLITSVQEYVHNLDIADSISDHQKDLLSLLKDWLEIRNEKSDRCTLLFDKMVPHFEAVLALDSETNSLLKRIWSERDMFPKLSQWIVSTLLWQIFSCKCLVLNLFHFYV